MLTLSEIQKDTAKFPSLSFEAKLEPVKGSQRPRTDTMCRVKIVSWCDGQVIPGGHSIPVGTHTAVVHERDLPIIMAMVEPEPEEIEKAREVLHRKVVKSCGDELKRCIDKNPDGEEQRAVLRKAYEMYPGSVAGEFRARNDRDIQPFASVEVIERNISAPATKETTDLQVMTAKLVAEHVNRGSSDVAAVVSGVIEQLAKAGVLKLDAAAQQSQKR